MSRYIKVLNEDGTFTEKKVYLDEDMEAFWKWAWSKGWYFDDTLEAWVNVYQLDDKKHKIEDVLKLWEEQK